MERVPDTLPMRTAAGERSQGKVCFAQTESTVRELLENASGRVLLLSEGAFAGAALSPRAVSLIYDGDALPLFAMPDGVSHIAAAGGEELLFAARYFAEVRGIPVTLFPESSTLAGCFEGRGELALGGERTVVPLAEGKVVCDSKRLSPTLAEGYARLLLSRLSALEARALTAFGLCVRGETVSFDGTEEGIVTANAARRIREREGIYAGEGVVLAGLLGGEAPSWNAYLLLTALYAAFFEKGKPRKYFTPDYRARAARAGANYPVGLPTAEEYVLRALALEGCRGEFAREFGALCAEREQIHREISRFGDLPENGGDLSRLQLLPERAPNGLSAIIRDFGLMEWTYDERGIAF